MADPVSLIGLVGLFHTCLEGYKICTAARAMDHDARMLRVRVCIERDRLLNWGKTCGFVPHHDRDTRKGLFKDFVQDSPLCWKNMQQTLESIGMLLAEAETLDNRCGMGGAPLEHGDSFGDEADHALAFRSVVSDGWRGLKSSLRSIRWSIKDKAAYEVLQNRLSGFNDALESLLPESLRHLASIALPATVLAANDEAALSEIERASSQHPELDAGVRWARNVHESLSKPQGKKRDLKEVHPELQSNTKASRYLAKCHPSLSTACMQSPASLQILVEWHPWWKSSDPVSQRARQIAGLLTLEKPPELRLLDCCGYVEEHDANNSRIRHAILYELPSLGELGERLHGRFTETKTLLQLLQDYAKKLPPSLDARFELAKNLCRSILLYHSSDWIHHDFRSHNVLFIVQPSPVTAIDSGQAFDNMKNLYQGCLMSKPNIIGLGFARAEPDASWTFEDKKTYERTIEKQRLYWSPAYYTSSKEKRASRNFQRSHDIYSLGCVLLELGVWQPLESYSWKREYSESQQKWHERLLREEDKIKSACGHRFAEVVMRCLTWGTSDLETDIQMLCWDLLQRLEELKV